MLESWSWNQPVLNKCVYFGSSGPTMLTLQDADMAKASANGQIKVGDYNFKLTVKDKEGLSSSTRLVVTIKKGKRINVVRRL